jgi:deazaflavin-dependent oxidoreductase (nitroreductase family)
VEESRETDPGRVEQALARLADEDYCYLTTTGRVTGRPHTIEIWFAASGGTLYMLSGGGDQADWVKNLRADPRVAVRIGGRAFGGRARVVTGAEEDALARRLLADKYGEYEDDGQPSEWARTALPVGVDVTG